MRRTAFLSCLLIGSATFAADNAAYLPADTDVVLTMQARKVAESELGKKIGGDLLQQLLRASKPAAALVEATGLDPLKDFDRITAGLDLNKTDPPKPFALFEGKFDAKKVEDSIDQYTKDHPDRIQPATIGGKAAYKLLGVKDAETMYAAIIDDTKIVVAPTDKNLTGAFAAAAGTRKPVISKELASVLANTRSPAPIFIQAWVKGKFNDVKVPNEKLKARLQGVEWATAAVNVTKDVSVIVTISAPDEAAAQHLSDLLGALVGLYRLQVLAATEDQPELKPIADLLRVTRVAPNGRTVVAAGSVKGEAIEKALNAPPAPKKK